MLALQRAFFLLLWYNQKYYSGEKMKEPNSVNSNGEQPYSQEDNETVAVGVGGYKMSQGYVLDEYLPTLQGERGRKKYREMSDHPTLGALLSAIEMILRAVEFKFEAAEADIDNYYVEFAESQFNNMDYTWDDILTEILTFLPYGFSLLEMVFRREEDGTITTARLAPRSQETIYEWDIDKSGKLQGVWQWPPYGGSRVYIPAKNLLHFKTKMERGNPEGRSIFRSAYTSYFYEKNISTIEAIAIERELAGLPVVKIPMAAFKNSTVRASYESIARDIKLNDQGGIVIPSDPYKDENGNPSSTPMYEVSLLSASGSRSIDTDKIILRHKQDMVRTVLADFLMLGSGDKGSFALSKSKTDLFLRSIEGYLSIITSGLDKWIKTLWDLNGYDPETMPKLITGRVAPVDLAELGAYIRDTGLMASMDRETENYIREIAGLPKPEDGDTI